MKLSELVLLVGEEGVLPSSRRYSEVRLCWNGLVDRFPLAVAFPRDSLEVAAVLRACTKRRQAFTVRGGGLFAEALFVWLTVPPGHNVAGSCIADGAILIDLSKLRSVIYRPDLELMEVGGGCLWSDVDAVAAPLGLSVPCGLISHTGVGGLTLGGGTGWLSRAGGMSCDAMVSAEVVLADGEIVQASEDENPDLLWALRGGGGNFGVVTRFDFRPTSVPPHCLYGEWCFSLAHVDEVLALYASQCASAPNSIALYCFITSAAIFVCGTDVALDREEEGWQEALFLSPYLKSANLKRLPIQEINQYFDRGNEHGSLIVWSRSVYLTPKQSNIDCKDTLVLLYHSVIEPLLSDANVAKEVFATFEIVPLGGRISSIPEETSCFAHRKALFEMHCIFSPAPGTESATFLENARRVSERYARELNQARETAPASHLCHIGGGYLNIDCTGKPQRAFGTNYERLQQVKARYDPLGGFRGHRVIAPLAHSPSNLWHFESPSSFLPSSGEGTQQSESSPSLSV